ncbi:MAG: hypothetical protein JF625_06025 [Inquilinus limosus]|uniref:EF-hand domain-containing protein n=1 Tax=Inquilinus limosus TaxID=171674 RepID=A0A952KGE6_9PROT|nr:hypothetical protein [Inquilinus limosus]
MTTTAPATAARSEATAMEPASPVRRTASMVPATAARPGASGPIRSTPSRSTPQETGIRALQERIADLKADPLADPHLIDALEAELADRIDQVKPGTGPTGDWETANLDVDGNGVVDDRDLELAREGFRPFD